MNGHIHLKISILCFIYIGFWPLEIKNKILKTLYGIYYKFTFTVYVILVLTQFVEIYMIIGNSLQEISFLLGVNLLYDLGFMKLWVVSRPDVKKLIRKVYVTEKNLFLRDEHAVREIYLKYASKNKRANLILLIVGLICDSLFALTPTFAELVDPPETLFHVINNSTVVYDPRPLPISSWFPFDRYKYYKISYAWHVLALAYIPIYLIACDDLFYGLTIFAIGQLKILQKSLKQLDTKTENLTEEIMKCVCYHKSIIQYVTELSSSVRTFLMMDFAACGLQIAVIGFQVAVSDVSVQLLNTIMYLLTMMVQLFLFYWYGNEVLVESIKVSSAIWECKWYEFDVKVKQDLLIIMMRAQKPLTLSIGPFYQMSVETMVSILKASYSYAAVMRRFYKDK